MANIIDLLMDWKNVTEKNDDISLLCVGYQMLLLASSLLTPGTILLMVLGNHKIYYMNVKINNYINYIRQGRFS